MEHVTLALTASETVRMLDVLGIEPHEQSPLMVPIALSPPRAGDAQMLERGLLIEDDGRVRPNLSVGLAVATLAAPDALTSYLWSNRAGVREYAVATAGAHRVGVTVGGDSIEMTYPLDRRLFIAALKAGVAPADDRSPPGLHAELTPTQHFVVGALARHHSSGWVTPATLATAIDADVTNLTSAAALVALDPAALDRLYRAPALIAEVLDELSHLPSPITIRSADGRYSLEPAYAELLSETPQGMIEGRRLDLLEPGGVITFNATLFAERALLTEIVGGGAEPKVQIDILPPARAVDLLAALLFDRDERRVLASQLFDAPEATALAPEATAP